MSGIVTLQILKRGSCLSSLLCRRWFDCFHCSPPPPFPPSLQGSPRLIAFFVIHSAQMFVGEMGCWLVVFASSVYRRYIYPRTSSDSSPLLAGGYQPVGTEDREDEEDNTLDGPHAADRVRKPSTDDTRIKLHGWKIVLLAAPACCDIAGTTLMNVGLLFVAASIYQMTRGALVLFVGLFSVLFLRRKLYLYQWLALLTVVLGVALVGLAGALFGGEHDHNSTQNAARAAMSQVHAAAKTPQAVQTIVGVLLIAAAQIFTASQFVLEEWILEHYAMDPLQVVGWEGTFGFLVTVIGMIILYFTVGRTEAGQYGYFDTKEGWRQITSNRAIAVSSILIMISIGYVYCSPSSLLRNSLTICSVSVASTSSASQSPARSRQHPAAQSTPHARYSSGSSHWVSDGRHLNGYRSWGSCCSCTARFCLIILFSRR